MNDDLIMEEPLFGEVSFDRTRMQNRIDDLEIKLAQINRLHEGLVKDKEEAFARKHRRLKANYETMTNYVECLKKSWPDDEPLPTLDDVPNVLPDVEDYGYVKDDDGVYHRIVSDQPNFMANVGYSKDLVVRPRDIMWPGSVLSTTGAFAVDKEEEEPQLILDDDEDD